ncbi:hypothetical protein F4804DRAFT_303354 [Jackrogersella minutella]|nr:hypothetical protein F4804DRAFT_303354 [Jackrogersella minutella]
MEPSTNASADQPIDEVQPYQLRDILRTIDELKESVLLENKSYQHANNFVESDFRSYQSKSLARFKDVMVAIQRKASKAIHEVELEMGPRSQLGLNHNAADAPLENLLGVSPGDELNRVLGSAHTDSKQSYKLRDFTVDVPIPQLIIGDDTVAPPLMNPDNPVVVLQPTLRNVWVVQHAYIRLLNHKEDLIKNYLASANLGIGTSRRFTREYYEDLSLAKLPSKGKLGNLLDVKLSSYNHATHDMMIVLVFKDADGGFRYVEAVTGDLMTDQDAKSNTYLVLPVSEASIKTLYGAYRALRKTTSEKRRAAKDKEFAAKMPVDAMDELEKKFNFGGPEDPSQQNGGGSRKRRRMLDDDE